MNTDENRFNVRSNLVIIITCICLSFVIAVKTLAGPHDQIVERLKFDYVGSETCKTCHEDIYNAWAVSSHSDSFKKFPAETQARVSKEPYCLYCHITGVDSEGQIMKGVQCESCHGPGSKYISDEIKDKEKWAADPEGQKKLAIEAGLIVPTEESCKSSYCHIQEGNPCYNEFNYDEIKEKIHSVKE